MADSKKTSSKKSIVQQAEAKAEQMTKAKANSSKGGKKPNRVVKYFKDLKSEFKKVVWPSKQKVINNTTVVVVAMTVCGLAIWGIDSGLAALLKLGLGA